MEEKTIMEKIIEALAEIAKKVDLLLEENKNLKKGKK